MHRCIPPLLLSSQALVLEELKALIGQLDPATKATMKNSLYRISRNAAVCSLRLSHVHFLAVCRVKVHRRGGNSGLEMPPTPQQH
jgi:hypothetical protein